MLHCKLLLGQGIKNETGEDGFGIRKIVQMINCWEQNVFLYIKVHLLLTVSLFANRRNKTSRLRVTLRPACRLQELRQNYYIPFMLIELVGCISLYLSLFINCMIDFVRMSLPMSLLPSLQWTATDQIMSKKDTKIFDIKGL